MTRYRFDSRVLDLETLELTDPKGLVDIEPQALRVLAYLVQQRQRVVPKEELLDEVWGDRFVSESALTTRIKHCRRAVGDDGRTQGVIRTVHGVGYRFVADVREERSTILSRSEPEVFSPRPVRRSLFGRDDELAALGERLDGHRLVTVTGVGGVGKSTLVSQFLTTSERDTAVWWCELANTRESGAFGAVVLAAMGEGQQSDTNPDESALRVLQRRRAVVVLDNCEHVVDAAAAFASAVLQRCPGVRILATSRIPLQVTGESTLPLGPLSLADSTRCFCARALDSGIELEAADPTVVELCRRLDGIPLALELAAARARTLAPSQMVELLRHRFRLLSDPAGGDDDRQQSLGRVVRWSWQSLTESDRDLLAALSTLVGSFSLDDAAAVDQRDRDIIDLADAVGRLVQASLVSVVTSAATDERRFRLLETIRDFARDHQRDRRAAEARHVRHFVERASSIDDGLLQSEDVDQGLVEMSSIWDNLRAAIGYAAEVGDTTSVRRIVRAVGAYADLYQSYEVLDWCDRASLSFDDVSDDEVPLTADAMAVQARLLAHRGQLDRARALADTAHDRNQSHPTVLAVVWCAYYRGDLARVLEATASLGALSRSERGIDRAFAEGFEAMVAAVRLVPGLDDSQIDTSVVWHGALRTFDVLVAGLRSATTNPVRAAELLEAVVEASLANEYRLMLGAASSSLIQVAVPQQPAADAIATVHRMLSAYRERGMWTFIAADVVMAARLLADQGDVDVAIRLLGARAASGFQVGLSEFVRVALTEELRSADPDRFSIRFEEGTRLSPLDAADAAIAALEHHTGTASPFDAGE